MNYILTLLVTVLLFTGCFPEESGESTSVLKSDISQKIDPKTAAMLGKAEIEAKTTTDLAEITMQKELGSKKLENELEIQKREQEMSRERLSIDETLELERIKQQTVILEQENRLELQRYIVGLSALLILLIAAAIYFFIKNRREDKLRAYNDNLEKYFRAKENEMRYKVANKVLDAISEGDLTKEQQTQLIATMQGSDVTRESTPHLIEDANIVDESNIDDITPSEDPDRPVK